MTNLTAIRHAIEHSSAAIGNEGEIKVLRDCYASLTPREQEVMKLVVSGILLKTTIIDATETTIIDAADTNP